MDTKAKGSHTVLVDHYRKAAESEGSSSGYKGLTIHALPGLHEFTFSLMQMHCQVGAAVLDLAAGTGAMSLRLTDFGYKVTATDYVSENFRLHESIPFFMADLNDHFAQGREEQFDAIMASEIIEHLENPRHFARACFKLLKKGGKVILSTPNVDSVASIVSLMRTGSFQWFSDADYSQDGHISPLTQWQLGKCFKEAGFTFLWTGSYGDRTEWLKGSPRLVLLSKLIDKLTTLKEDLKNQIFVAVLEKPCDEACSASFPELEKS
jgi:SAM-dependent methyltransferase